VLHAGSSASSAFEAATGGDTIFEYLQRPKNAEEWGLFDNAMNLLSTPAFAAISVDYPWQK
jgi:hypothetical protein